MRRPAPILRACIAAAAGALGVALLAGGLAAPAAAASEPLPGTATSQFLSGWLPYWRGNTEIDRILPRTGADGYVGEVNLFWAYSRYRTGELQDPLCIHDGSDVKVTECARTAPTTSQIAQLGRLRTAGVKTYLSFTDDSSKLALAGVLKYQDPVSLKFTKRDALVAAQVNFVVANDIDGIDLDYEGFAFSDGSVSWATTKPAWIAYINALATGLHAKGKKLSMTVPAGYPVYGAGFNASSGYWVYAWKDVIGVVDRLRIMSYDYSWDTPGPIGPANWVDAVAGDAVEELGTVNARKVWIGVAAYGYDWRLSTTCTTPTLSKRPTRYPQAAWDIYNEAKTAGRVLPTAGQTVDTAAIRYDSTSGEYTYRYKQLDVDKVTKAPCSSIREVWFQDARSHVDRALIAAKYQLAGIAMWAFGDERDATWTSLTAAAPSIKPYTPTLSLLASPTITYGQTATAGVTVTRPDSAPVPAVAVAFKWKPTGSTAWSVVGTALTDDSGSALVSFKPTTSGTWQATTPSAIGRQSGTSGTMPTSVASSVSTAVRSISITGYITQSAVVNNRVTATVKKGSSAQLAGRVLAARGQTMTLLRKGTDGVWRVVTYVKASSTGYYTFAVSTKTAGTYSYLIRATATATLAKGQSKVVVLTVAP